MSTHCSAGAAASAGSCLASEFRKRLHSWRRSLTSNATLFRGTLEPTRMRWEDDQVRMTSLESRKANVQECNGVSSLFTIQHRERKREKGAVFRGIFWTGLHRCSSPTGVERLSPVVRLCRAYEGQTVAWQDGAHPGIRRREKKSLGTSLRETWRGDGANCARRSRRGSNPLGLGTVTHRSAPCTKTHKTLEQQTVACTDPHPVQTTQRTTQPHAVTPFFLSFFLPFLSSCPFFQPF